MSKMRTGCDNLFSKASLMERRNTFIVLPFTVKQKIKTNRYIMITYTHRAKLVLFGSQIMVYVCFTEIHQITDCGEPLINLKTQENIAIVWCTALWTITKRLNYSHRDLIKKNAAIRLEDRQTDWVTCKSRSTSPWAKKMNVNIFLPFVLKCEFIT